MASRTVPTERNRRRRAERNRPAGHLARPRAAEAIAGRRDARGSSQPAYDKQSEPEREGSLLPAPALTVFITLLQSHRENISSRYTRQLPRWLNSGLDNGSMPG